MSDITHHRVLITPKVYLCLKLKSVLEILYYFFHQKALKSISIIARLEKTKTKKKVTVTFTTLPNFWFSFKSGNT